MSKLFHKRAHIIWGLVLLASLMLLDGCAKHVEPTATPQPTPDAQSIYIMLTRKYTSFDAIVRIHDMSADEAARILQALQAVTPPAGFEALHEQALNAYRHICKGKLLLIGADNIVRSEAYFMIDWGVSRLLDYREQLDKLRQPGY